MAFGANQKLVLTALLGMAAGALLVGFVLPGVAPSLATRASSSQKSFLQPRSSGDDARTTSTIEEAEPRAQEEEEEGALLEEEEEHVSRKLGKFASYSSRKRLAKGVTNARGRNSTSEEEQEEESEEGGGSSSLGSIVVFPIICFAIYYFFCRNKSSSQDDGATQQAGRQPTYTERVLAMAGVPQQNGTATQQTPVPGPVLGAPRKSSVGYGDLEEEGVAAQQQAQPQLVQVPVPAGVSPGMRFTVQLPDGRQIEVICPEGAGPGQAVMMQC